MPFEMDSTISIHAPRERGDSALGGHLLIRYISIHAPPARGATKDGQLGGATTIFQSTPPARGATAKMHSFTCGSLTNK